MKNFIEYSHHKTHSDGLASICKHCEKEYRNKHKAYYAKLRKKDKWVEQSCPLVDK